ncbi:MAG: BLUF domain-containing protein [Planctomycetota bacterium]
MFRRILYSSLAAEGIGMRDAYDIIRLSHNRNSKAGLTGCLILLDGFFYQLLEGLPSAVDFRFSRISQDPRHVDIAIRQDQTVDRAIFTDEWMALRDGSEIEPELLAKHNYIPGMPSTHFTGEEVLAMMLECFSDSCKEEFSETRI